MFTHRLFHLLMVIALLTITACSSQPAATPDPTATPAPTEPPLPTATPDPKLVLVGSWITTVTKEDLVRVRPEFPPEHLCENAGTFGWTFNADGTFTIDQTALSQTARLLPTLILKMSGLWRATCSRLPKAH